jgi:integrase
VSWHQHAPARHYGACFSRRTGGEIAAVNSLHDLRHAFAQRNAGRGLVWLRERLGHSSVSVTERYLRDVLRVDTEKMQRPVGPRVSVKGTAPRFRALAGGLSRG